MDRRHRPGDGPARALLHGLLGGGRQARRGPSRADALLGPHEPGRVRRLARMVLERRAPAGGAAGGGGARVSRPLTRSHGPPRRGRRRPRPPRARASPRHRGPRRRPGHAGPGARRQGPGVRAAGGRRGGARHPRRGEHVRGLRRAAPVRDGARLLRDDLVLSERGRLPPRGRVDGCGEPLVRAGGHERLPGCLPHPPRGGHATARRLAARPSRLPSPPARSSWTSTATSRRAGTTKSERSVAVAATSRPQERHTAPRTSSDAPLSPAWRSCSSQRAESRVRRPGSTVHSGRSRSP